MQVLSRRLPWYQSQTFFHCVAACLAIGLASMGVLLALALHSLEFDLKRRMLAAQDLLLDSKKLHQTSVLLQAEMHELKEAVSTIREEVPDSPEESSFLAQLSKLATQEKISVSEFRPGSTLRFSDHRELELSFNCSGSYEGICKLLARLPEIPRKMRLSQLNLSPPSAQQGNYRAELRLRLICTLESEGDRPKPSREGVGS